MCLLKICPNFFINSRNSIQEPWLTCNDQAEKSLFKNQTEMMAMI